MRARTFTSESVTEGHPDKVADQISDAVLDAHLEVDAGSRVACETLTARNLVVISGEITSVASVDVEQVARSTILDVGYGDPRSGFDGATCSVQVSLAAQSPDIARGVDASEEARSGDVEDGFDELGAGDQGMMFGYATDETDVLMPLPIHVAHRLAERLAEVRKDGTLEYLRPDGKTQVSFEYGDDGSPRRLATVLISTQHGEGVDRDRTITPDLIQHVIKPVVPDAYWSDEVEIYVNPTGRFVLGGPAADTGLTGRKIIVDTYGGMARHGGGAFSGKDATKVDRSASYATRWVAKNIVASGAARRCEVQVAYAIGRARPVSLHVETFDTERADRAKLEDAVAEIFDLRPAAILRDLDLRRPIYRPTATYGHFGRVGDGGFTWERTDRVEELQRALGL